jgi:deazaflavin-dependent oxidoreductase (nitroreductase family)
MSVEDQTVDKNRPARKTSKAQSVFTGIHTFFYRLSGGKMGGRLGKSPILLLITTGRKTGKPRTTPLFYLKDGDDLILVASDGGSATHPTWWLNLQANPQAGVELGKKKLPVTARHADAEESKRLWPLLVEMYAGYAGYQKKTIREIPLVILSPRHKQE